MNVADLLTTPPATTAGNPTGGGDWRCVVELALPHDADSTWGVATWGAPTTWGGLAWSDITDKVRGVEWYRGSDEPYGRPRIGELIATIDARSTLSPITNESAYYAPGTLIRVSILHPTRTQEWSPGTSFTWLPQFTGLIDSWPLTSFGQFAEQQVEVRARVAYLPDASPFPEELSAPAVLDLVGALGGLRRRERRERAAALLERVGLAAARRGTVIVGEDLGVVPEGLRDALSASGIYGCSVAMFERWEWRLRAPWHFRAD